MNNRSLIMEPNGAVHPLGGEQSYSPAGRRMVLLIHGYNNNKREASESYFALRRNLDGVLAACQVGEPLRRSFQEEIWEFYWPGFKSITQASTRGITRGTPETALSSLTYPLELRKARGWVPDGLTAYLKQNAPSELFLVGHSLGCRVALETIHRLFTTSSIPITGFLLMAGAVPIHLLTRTQALAQSAIAATGNGKRYCLYSWHDSVLFGAFPLGQIALRETPLYVWPVATGLSGAPSELYTMQSHTGLDHGDYWKGGIFQAPSPYAELLAQVFGFMPAKPVTQRAIFATRAVRASERSVPEHLLGLRLLPGADWLSDIYSPAYARE